MKCNRHLIIVVGFFCNYLWPLAIPMVKQRHRLCTRSRYLRHLSQGKESYDGSIKDEDTVTE